MKHREHEYEEIFKLYIFSFQVSLSRMILDIFKFCCLYLLVLFAFSCGNWLFYHCYQLMMPPIIILMNIWSWNVFLSLMALWPQCPRINIIRKFLAGECTKNVVFQKKPLQDCPKLILPWFNGTVVNNGSDKVEKSYKVHLSLFSARTLAHSINVVQRPLFEAGFAGNSTSSKTLQACLAIWRQADLSAVCRFIFLQLGKKKLCGAVPALPLWTSLVVNCTEPFHYFSFFYCKFWVQNFTFPSVCVSVCPSIVTSPTYFPSFPSQFFFSPVNQNILILQIVSFFFFSSEYKHTPN